MGTAKPKFCHMNHRLLFRFSAKNVRFFLISWLCLISARLMAFPPAPSYTLYGTVRDQVGQTLKAEGAAIILLKDGVEIGRTPITSDGQLDQNYELSVRIDQNRSGTALYSENAVAAQGAFSLVVEMNGSLFYPIEVAGTLTAGKGGERVRLDLNLGEDLDHDGLPDVWEAWQLYQSGQLPGEDGKWKLDLIDKDGDFDRDGQSNYQEYLAGTFAGDATEKFTLNIKEKSASHVKLEFYGITGKTYTIERSLDMKTWARVPFTVGAQTEASEVYQAVDVSVQPAFVAPAPAGNKEFYRLTVR